MRSAFSQKRAAVCLLTQKTARALYDSLNCFNRRQGSKPKHTPLSPIYRFLFSDTRPAKMRTNRRRLRRCSRCRYSLIKWKKESEHSVENVTVLAIGKGNKTYNHGGKLFAPIRVSFRFRLIFTTKQVPAFDVETRGSIAQYSSVRYSFPYVRQIGSATGESFLVQFGGLVVGGVEIYEPNFSQTQKENKRNRVSLCCIVHSPLGSNLKYYLRHHTTEHGDRGDEGVRTGHYKSIRGCCCESKQKVSPIGWEGNWKEASQKKGQQTDLGTKILALPALSLARKCGLTCGTGGGVCCFSPLCSLCFKLMC